MITVFDSVFYILKDLLVCFTFVTAGVHLLGGKFRKNIPMLVLLPVLLIANAVFCIFLFNGTEEDRLLILDVVSGICYIFAVSFLLTDLRLGKRIWFLLICAFTMEMFYSLFAPYLPAHIYATALVYIVMYSVFLFVILYNKHNAAVNSMPQVFDGIPKWIFVAILFFDLTGYYKSFGESYDWYNILYIASSIGVIVCVLFFVFKIFSLTYQQNEILRRFNEQKDYSEKMLRGDENLRKFRHDYRNHMIVVNAMLESGNIDRAREYINAMNADINDTVNKISTGNFVADAIFNNKAIVAAQNGNRIVFSGQIPAQGIQDADLCTVLANALDNALEAATKIAGNSTIEAEAAVRNGIFILTISNPVAERVIIGKNNTIRTTKKNKNEHGLGTKNIQKVVKKYNGALSLDCTDNIFTFSIRLNLQSL